MRPDYATWRQAIIAANHGAARTEVRHTVTSYRDATGDRRWQIGRVPTGCVFCWSP